VHHIGSGIFKALKVGGSKCLGIGEPGRTLIGLEGSQHPKQGERVKHIHNRAALDEIDGARRVCRCTFRKDLKPTAIDHRHG
jgi:hypothetical protein